MKKIVLILLPFFLSPGQQTHLAVPYIRFMLANGLNVIIHEDHTTPTVCVNIHYNVGSANEKPGRTGFAHLFEHLMFEGSGHVPEGKFDEWLEAAGGDNNGSTTNDRTNYYENVPSNALELPLYLDSDRMGFLVDAMSPAKVDAQRDVVKNERRQSYENQPYGLSSIIIDENVYPPNHPYHWSTIGSMEDLSAASFDDVVEFFRKYYVPNNATLAIAGDVDPVKARALVEKWFGGIPRGNAVPPIEAPPAVLTEEKRIIMEDKVQLPRLYLTWISPSQYSPGDAELDLLSSVLTGGKNSRLYKRLVYDMQIAQDVGSGQASGRLSSEFGITATARQGHTLTELENVIDEELEKLKAGGPSERELQRAVNQFEAGFLNRLERIGGFGGLADQLNSYYLRTGNPDYFQEDFARYTALDPGDLRSAATTFLPRDGRVVLSVVPTGKRELASTKEGRVGK